MEILVVNGFGKLNGKAAAKGKAVVAVCFR
jgi:hypothetical protein